jgi:hypothetical protein
MLSSSEAARYTQRIVYTPKPFSEFMTTNVKVLTFNFIKSKIKKKKNGAVELYVLRKPVDRLCGLVVRVPGC